MIFQGASRAQVETSLPIISTLIAFPVVVGPMAHVLNPAWPIHEPLLSQVQRTSIPDHLPLVLPLLLLLRRAHVGNP